MLLLQYLFDQTFKRNRQQAEPRFYQNLSRKCDLPILLQLEVYWNKQQPTPNSTIRQITQVFNTCSIRILYKKTKCLQFLLQFHPTVVGHELQLLLLLSQEAVIVAFDRLAIVHGSARGTSATTHIPGLWSCADATSIGNDSHPVKSNRTPSGEGDHG